MSLQSVASTVVPLCSNWSLIIWFLYHVLYEADLLTLGLSWLNTNMINHLISNAVQKTEAFSMQKHPAFI